MTTSAFFPRARDVTDSGGDLQTFFRAIKATVDIDVVREQVEGRLYETRQQQEHYRCCQHVPGCAA